MYAPVANVPLAEPTTSLPHRPYAAGAHRGFPGAMPYRATAHTVEWMRVMGRAGEAHPEVRRYAVEVVRSVYPKAYASEIAAIYYDVCRRVRYTRDPVHIELVQHPAVTLAARSGDCDDGSVVLRAAIAAASAEAAVGGETQYVTAAFAPGEHTHVFARVRDPRTGEWVVLDPVAGPHTADMLRKVRTFRAYDS